MSLRKGTTGATPPITDYALDELWRKMNDVGILCMTTDELEQWSYLMAESLEGKGDGPIREAHTISTEGPRSAV